MMIRLSLLSLLSLISPLAFAAEGAPPKPDAAPAATAAGDGKLKTLTYNCEAWAEGVPPKDVFVVDGTVKIGAKDGNKAIVIEPLPIVDANAQVGESATGEESIMVKVFASKKGRSYPRFGVSVHGNSGYRMIVNCARRQLELVKNDETVATAPYTTWATDTWTFLKLEARQREGGKWVISGKAWAADGAEPADPQLSHPDPKLKGQGKAGIWGTPFSEMPIYFDDLKIEVATKAAAAP